VGAALPECKYNEAGAEIALRPSRIALLGVCVLALATLVLIAATPGSPGLRILVATWVACLSLEAIHGVALRRGARGVRAILMRRSREIEVQMANGLWHAGLMCDGSFVAPWLTIVRWRPQGSRFDRTVVILPDMLGAAEFRRLRVLLRWS
jgi:toxin CptA